MLMQVAILGGALIVGVVAIALVFLLGMRAKSPLVLSPLIRLQRAMINPKQMRSAGTPGAYAAVIRHRGRTSGRPYETPVGVVAVDDGFLIALVYGSRTNWLQNVLASGSATIVHEGHSYQVDRPEIIPMQAVSARFTGGDQRGFRWLAVDKALRVRRVEPAGARVTDTGPRRARHPRAVHRGQGLPPWSMVSMKRQAATSDGSVDDQTPSRVRSMPPRMRSRPNSNSSP